MKKIWGIFVLLLLMSCLIIQMPQPTGKIFSEIYTILSNRPYVNFYLLQIGESYMAIDAGADSVQTARELQRLDISANDVIAVFVTHSHYDHISALDLFGNATVYTGNSTLPNTHHQIMRDGEIIELSGRSIKCIYTPGHTSDSVCYLVDGKYLFVGDSLINHLNNTDNELRKLSIEKLLELEGLEYIFSGHYGFMNERKFQKEYRKQIEKRRIQPER